MIPAKTESAMHLLSLFRDYAKWVEDQGVEVVPAEMFSFQENRYVDASFERPKEKVSFEGFIQYLFNYYGK